MTPASGERASENDGRSGRRSERATRCPVPRPGVASSPPPHQPEHAPRTDPRLRRGYGRGGSRGSVRGGGRDCPQATAPDPISPERGMWQPRNGRPAI
eukprot:5227780-Pleurochrysis_carterae.AAC.1